MDKQVESCLKDGRNYEYTGRNLDNVKTERGEILLTRVKAGREDYGQETVNILQIFLIKCFREVFLRARHFVQVEKCNNGRDLFIEKATL